MPDWSLPSDLAEQLEAEGKVEIPGWKPISVMVLGATVWQGQANDMSWQIEIPAGTKGLDGYTIETLILDELRKADPQLAGRCHSDSERATCVLWVEQEGDCRALLQCAWPLLS